MTAAVSAQNAAASAVAVMAAEVAEDATNAETDKKVAQTVVAKADQRLAMNNAVSNEMMAGLQMAAAASAANAVLTHALASSAVTHAMSEAKAKSSASRVHRVSPESQEKADVKSAPAVNAASVAASSAPP